MILLVSLGIGAFTLGLGLLIAVLIEVLPGYAKRVKCWWATRGARPQAMTVEL